MVCSGHNHYFTFLRRIFHKIGYLNEMDYRIDLEPQVRQIERKELRTDTEWLMYNDDQVGFVKGNWPSVVSMCME